MYAIRLENKGAVKALIWLTEINEKHIKLALKYKQFEIAIMLLDSSNLYIENEEELIYYVMKKLFHIDFKKYGNPIIANEEEKDSIKDLILGSKAKEEVLKKLAKIIDIFGSPCAIAESIKDLYTDEKMSKKALNLLLDEYEMIFLQDEPLSSKALGVIIFTLFSLDGVNKIILLKLIITNSFCEQTKINQNIKQKKKNYRPEVVKQMQ